MLSIDGWINGISATFCILFACILGLGIMYQAKKSNAKLLFYMGLNILLASFLWLIPFFDFFSILLTGGNFVNSRNWIAMGILTYITIPLLISISIYIGLELMKIKGKYYIIAFFMFLTALFEIIIFLYPENSFFTRNLDLPQGEDLIVVGIRGTSFAMILVYLFQFSGISFCGFGYLYKSFRSEGVLKKKFLTLSIGYFLFPTAPLLSLLRYVIPIIIWWPIIIDVTVGRIGMASSFCFFYLGLKEEPEIKIRAVKEIKVKDSLFRLYKRPGVITEEEVIFHREKKICLVCKGKVLRVSYICPSCNALYCINCSQELSNLENACWVCNEAFDETKPVKPHKILRKKPTIKKEN